MCRTGKARHTVRLEVPVLRHGEFIDIHIYIQRTREFLDRTNPWVVVYQQPKHYPPLSILSRWTGMRSPMVMIAPTIYCIQ